MAGKIGKGGKKGRSGRKSKAEEFGLATLIEEAWPRVKRLAMLGKWADRATMGDLEAGKLLMAYAYGKPKEQVELSINPASAAKDTLQTIMAETGLSEAEARAIVSKTFGVSEQELISESVN